MLHQYVIRQVQESDLPIVVDLDYEAFSPYGTAEDPGIFTARYRAFPAGFIVLEQGPEIAAYGCSEKWLSEREPGLNESPLETHKAAGKIFCITGMAVRVKYRGKGYGLAVLDSLIQVARGEHCVKIMLETTHAQGLYLKRSFQVIRSRSERGISLDVMALELV